MKNLSLLSACLCFCSFSCSGDNAFLFKEPELCLLLENRDYESVRNVVNQYFAHIHYDEQEGRGIFQQHIQNFGLWLHQYPCIVWTNQDPSGCFQTYPAICPTQFQFYDDGQVVYLEIDFYIHNSIWCPQIHE